MPAPDDAARRDWLGEIGRLARTISSPIDVVVSVASALDPSFPERGLRLRGRRFDVPPPPTGAGPELLGAAYEATVDAANRRRAGVHYTPSALARRLAELALDGLVDGSVAVCDPACGGGAFLLAAGEVLASHRLARREIVELRLWGIDVDPLAVAVTEAALYLWSGSVPGNHLVAGDALTEPWPARPDGGFTAVVGNPPFLSQLSRATTRRTEVSDRLRCRFGDLIGPYTDTAWVFLLAALEAVRPGGRVVLVQPQSVLSARDAAGIRQALTLEGLWLTEEPVFAASVRVCAPVIKVGDRPHEKVRRWAGRDVTELPPAARPVEGDNAWAELAAGLLGVPEVELDGARRLGDLARATAGFRDQFYGLAGFVVDDDGDKVGPKLITSGIIDPGRIAWGERPVRFAGRRWMAPRVDLSALVAGGRPAVARWVEDRLVPKVVVATQSSIVEAAVDRDGRWVPSTPVISVAASVDRLDHVAAVLLAPPVTAWARRRFAGAALATGSVKLAARQVLELPIPESGPDWDAAARLVARLPEAVEPIERRSVLVAAGERMVAAYGLDRGDELLEWWAARLRA
jgi:hypothetical protein